MTCSTRSGPHVERAQRIPAEYQSNLRDVTRQRLVCDVRPLAFFVDDAQRMETLAAMMYEGVRDLAWACRVEVTTAADGVRLIASR